MERILFSPVGDTDPVRGCCDGACLHIVRHYKPVRVILFYTQEMEEKEMHDHRYTRAIKRLAPDCAIENVFSGIRDAHLYESFGQVLPQEVQKALTRYGKIELLLNLSSGTPQIKTVLAMLAADLPRTRGVQVASPLGRSNRANEATQDKEDVEALLENNLDDEPGAKNRCEEPPLWLFRYYAEKNRILALAHAYEYRGALLLAEKNARVPKDALRLLRHAANRAALLTEKARKALAEYQGRPLFLFRGGQERVIEYFLLMQIEQKNGRLSNLMMRIVPFLYELLRGYVDRSPRPLRALCLKKGHGGLCLQRSRLEQDEPDFLALLDRRLPKPYRDSDLSFLLLYWYCEYMETEGLASDSELHGKLLEEIRKVKNATRLRNDVAHEITDVTEERFSKMLNMGSQQMMKVFFQMLCLLYGEKAGEIRWIYDSLNIWLERALDMHE